MLLETYLALRMTNHYARVAITSKMIHDEPGRSNNLQILTSRRHIWRRFIADIFIIETLLERTMEKANESIVGDIVRRKYFKWMVEKCRGT